MRAPEVARLRGLQKFVDRAEFDEIKIFGNTLGQPGDLRSFSGKHLLPRMTLNFGPREGAYVSVPGGWSGLGGRPSARQPARGPDRTLGPLPAHGVQL